MIRDFDISSPKTLQNPYPMYAVMRDESPVGRLMPAGLYGVSRHEDVLRVFKNTKHLSNRGYTELMRKDATEPEPEPEPSIITADPPYHTQMRNLITKAFTPRVVAQLEPRIREISRALVGKVARASSIDLVNDITIPLPTIVIAELLGVGPEKQHEFKRWSDDLMTTVAVVEPKDPARVARSTEELNGYFMEMLKEREREPKADIMSDLLRAEVEGQKLSMPEVLSFATTLLIAGNETTTALIGNAMVALTDNPDQYEEVRSKRALIPNLIEEVLRYQSPAQCVFRLAVEDVEIAGEVIPKGSLVLPLIGSANRDPRKFKDADKFDIHRDTKGHIAFGQDIHFCIGAALARLEGRVILEVMLEELPALRRKEQEVTWVPSMIMRTPHHLTLETA
jgi:cytochrome P450